MRFFFVLILVGLLSVGSLGYVAKKVQDSEFLVERSKEVNLYSRLTNQIGSALPQAAIDNMPFDEDGITSIVKESIPADEFYSFLEKYTQTHLDYFSGRNRTINFEYSLTGVKDRAEQAIARELIKSYDNLEACTTDQIRRWSAADDFPECRLPEGAIERSSIERQLAALAGTALQEIPDEIVVDSVSDRQYSTRLVVSRANTVTNISWIAALVVALLMFIIWRARALIPIGLSLLFVGLVQIGFSLVAWDWLGESIKDFVTGSSDISFAELVIDIVVVSLEILKTALGNLTIVILGAGLATLVLGIVTSVRGRKKGLSVLE